MHESLPLVSFLSELTNDDSNSHRNINSITDKIQSRESQDSSYFSSSVKTESSKSSSKVTTLQENMNPSEANSTKIIPSKRLPISKNSSRPLFTAKSMSSASILRRKQEVKPINNMRMKEHSDILANSMAVDTQINMKKGTTEFQRNNILFKSCSHHSQIFPVMTTDNVDNESKPHKGRRSSAYSINSLPVYQLKGSKNVLESSSSLSPMIESNTNTTTTTTTTSTSSLAMDSILDSPTSLVSTRPGSAIATPNLPNGKTFRSTLSTPLRKHYTTILNDDKEINTTGHRIGQGDVNFNIVYDMLTGIRYTVSSRMRHKYDNEPLKLIDKDFRFNNKLIFDRKGSEPLQDSILTHYEFKFKDYAPKVFKALRKIFGLDEKDYLESLTSKYILNEQNSPGKSGSFFYYSGDYKYIIKTIHHVEHTHLRKSLQKYYNYVKDNPNTLICQFYGVHRVQLPITFKNGIKNKKVYFIVMNNVFPPELHIDTTFDLKGSLWGRYTNIPDHLHPRNKNKHEDINKQTNGDRIILKDLNWLEQKVKLNLNDTAKNLFLKQLKKDLDLLGRLNTMDYSLLIGIHYIGRSDDNLTDFHDNYFQEIDKNVIRDFLKKGKPKDLPRNLFTHFNGGILSDDLSPEGDQLIYFVGIIDCLTNYSIIKRLETFWRGINHKREVVSSIPPKQYGDRLYTFIVNSTEKPKEHK